jgi:hypothetical protein
MMKLLILLGCSLSLSTQAQQFNDDYYANDVIKAIKEAKHRPHHYDYSNVYRYSRTTSQSLDIPKLMSGELSDTAITDSVASDPLNPDSVAVDSSKPKGSTVRRNISVGSKSNSIRMQPAVKSNVSSQSTIRAYARP